MDAARSAQIAARMRIAAVAGVALVALAELIASIWASLGASVRPSQAPAVRAALSSIVQAGDLFAPSPPALAGPVLGMAGDSLPRGTAEFVDPARFGRAVELAASWSSTRALSDWDRNQELRAGSLRLRVLRNPKPVPVKYDLVATVQSPDVQVTTGPAGGGGVPCGLAPGAEVDLPAGSPVPWAPRGRLSCAPEPAAFVAQVIMSDANDVARRCIWTYPGTNAIRVTWAKVPAATSVRGGVAVGAGAGGKPRARVRFSANGAAIGELQADSSSVFDSFEFPAAVLASGGGVTLEVEQLGDQLAPVCVEASLR
jgi:hypothetical protein